MKIRATRRRVALSAAGALFAGALVGLPIGTAHAATSCDVTYATNDWNTGFTANVTVTNTGSRPINGWTLNFTLPGGQQITNFWNAAVTGRSGPISARNIDHNGTLAPGGNTAFGFQGTYTGSYSTPGSFTLNGTTCARA